MVKKFIQKLLFLKKGFYQINADLNKIIIFNSVHISFPKKLTIEPYVRIGHNSHLDAQGKIIIKSGVTLSPYVTILSSTHNFDNPKYIPFDEKDLLKKVIIGEGTWIAWGVTILPGVTIGKNCIIYAKSVVSKDIPDNSIAAGQPAKVIKKRNISEELLKSESIEKYYQYHVIEKKLKRL